MRRFASAFLGRCERVVSVADAKPGAITATFTVFGGTGCPRAVFGTGGWNTWGWVEKQTKFKNDLSVHGSTRGRRERHQRVMHTSDENNAEIIHDLESGVKRGSMEAA